MNINYNIGLLYAEAAELGIENCDTIAPTELYRQVNLMKTNKILADHPYKITLLSNGRWQTYIKDPVTHKPKTMKAPTKEALIEKLKEHYSSGQTDIDNLTLNELYKRWLPYKQSITQSDNTILRHEQHYKKYFEGTPFFRKTVLSICKQDLRIFCNRLVKERNLTSSEWTNVKTILLGMFSYAEEKYGIPNPTLPSIKIEVKFRQKTRKVSEKEVFNTEEQKNLREYLDRHFTESEDLSFLAIRLNLLLGLRIGELSSLRWEDIVEISRPDEESGEMHLSYKLHICREEVMDKRTNKVSVEDHTKTHTARYVILIPEAIRLLDKAREISGNDHWIFTRNGERLRSRQLEYVLDKYAERSGVKIKSSHKIRKTYASNLDAAGVPLEDIREALGHSTSQTTLKYLFSVHTEQEKHKRFEAALSL